MTATSTDAPQHTRSRTRRRTVRLAAAALAAAGLVTAGVVAADAAAPARHGDTIPNLTLVDNQIKAYYGDTVIDGEHYASPTGNYATEVEGVESRAKNVVAFAVKRHTVKPAIVLDVDDTTLLTYNYELENGFAYSPATNTPYIVAEKMSAVFGMVELADWAKSQGVTVFYVTGRPESQRDATEGNLAKVGYDSPGDATHLFLKNPASPPSYLACGATCTTIQYKAGTRAHIESLGYDIVADLGDQYSDLSGGYADHTFKLPNPMYYIP
jgi:phosphoglycolate phosphatase-like HAD superfamily hydrolase